MVQGSRESLREHSHRSRWKQGRREGQKGQGQADHLPQKEEPPVLRYLCQVKLSVWEALHLAPQKTRRVSLLNPNFSSLINLIFIYSDPNLTLTEAPLLKPEEIVIDQEQIQTMTKELEDVANMELPEGDDEDFWALTPSDCSSIASHYQ